MTETGDSGGTAVADHGRAEVEAVLQGRSRRTAAVSLIREAALLPVLGVLIVVGAFGLGTKLNPYLGILIVLAVGAAVGIVNGLRIVKGRLNGFIVTLGMTMVLAGLQQGIVHGN